MSTSTTIPANVGICGNKNISYYSNPDYYIADAMNQTILEMYTTMDPLEHGTPFDNNDKAALIQKICTVYTKSQDYVTKAIDNKTSYECESFETFATREYELFMAVPSTRAVIREASNKRGAQMEYQTLAPRFQKIIEARHQELLKLIKIQEKTFPSLESAILRWQNLRCEKATENLSENPFLSINETFSTFLDRLNKASEGPNSPIFNAKIEKTMESAEPSSLPLPEAPLNHLKDSPVSAPTAQIIVNYNVGFGRTLGICCAAINNWKTPVLLSNSGNEWKGNVPTGKEWKFVILRKDVITHWETAKNRNCPTTTDRSILNYTGQVTFPR